MRSSFERRYFCALLAIVGCFKAGMASAQQGPNTGLLTPDPGVTPQPDVVVGFGDGIIADMGSILTNYSGAIGDITTQLMLSLLVADLVINTGRTVITNSSLGEFLTRFAYRVLFILLAMFVINNIVEIVEFVGNAAVRLARGASDAGSFVEPSVSAIILDGITNALRLLGEISIWKPVSIFYVLSAVLMLIVTAVQVAMIVITYAELYLSTLAGLIVMAFAGLENAKDSAVRYIRNIIGKGLSLLTLLIVFSMFSQLLLEIAERDSQSLGLDNVVTMLILQVISVLLMMTLPSSVEGLAGGIGSSAAARIAAGVVAAAAIKAVAPIAAATGTAAASGTAAAVGGASNAASTLAKGGSAGEAVGAAASGAARAGGRYARAGFSRDKSITSELASDGGRLANQMRNVLSRDGGSSE
jgi:P-type conjugative transfer protein TrbL